ncbi:MAG TPA: 7TM-DISM domain-containing protein, partial [Xanthomonadaceae bacterium]|nr:7TM-DISM domain-containing protein [Xanthomonadaceae bacterium]
MLGRWTQAVLWLLLAFGALAGRAHAAEPLRLVPGNSQSSLTPFVAYYHDTNGTDDAAAALRRVGEGGFAPLPDGNTAFGFQSGAFWFHARLINQDPAEPRWLLLQEYALSDHIDVYLRYPDGRLW